MKTFLVSNKYKIPTDCSECNYLSQNMSQGNLCHRCPVFNCTGEDALFPPEDYREDWAKEFFEWFEKKTPLNDLPKLKFQCE